MTTKRRASRGSTHDPYPCCGADPETDYGRPKGGICRVCLEYIEMGKESEKRSALAGDKPYTWAREAHWWPGYYGQYDFSDEDRRDFRSRTGAQDVLTDSMYVLVNELSTPAKGAVLDERYFAPNVKTMGRLLDCKQTHARYDGTMAVMINQGIRDRLNNLDAAIRRALESVYKEGLRKGGSVLLQLAGGDLTVNDFNRKTGRGRR